MSESQSSTHDGVPDDDPTTELVHVTIDGEDAPGACTMYPRDVDEDAIATAWITAHEGSFVALQEMR